MADAFAQFEILLREHISPAVTDLEFEDDDPSWNLIGTFQPETVGGKRHWDVSAGDYPPGYEARYEIKVQSGGRVAGGTFSGNTMTMMGKDTHLAMGQGLTGKYLDPRYTPLPGYVEINMVLKRIRGSAALNHQMIMADLATKPVDQVAGNAVIDATKRVRGYLLNYVYGNGTPTMAQVNNAAGYTITETAGGVAVAIDFGTWGRFMKGDRIVAGSDADPRVQRAGAINSCMRVVSIDDDLRTIRLQSEPGEGNISLSDNDHLMLADTYDFTAASVAAGTLTPNGYESLLISSGTYPGSVSPMFQSGLDVAHHTELKGYVSTSSPQINPTMDALTELLDKIADLRKVPPTAMIAERSIWTLHAELERENQAMVMVPMGATFNAAGGVAGPMLSHMENRFTRFSSSRIRPNCVIGINPTTFMKFMPMGDRAIHWVFGSGPLAGYPSIFYPVQEGAQLTELVDAPFNVYAEFGCKDPKSNLRKIGVNAKRDI